MADHRSPATDRLVTEHVHVRYTKWDASLHWHFDTQLLGHDGHGAWLAVPPGGSYRRGDESPRTDEFGFVVLVPEADWWTAYFNPVPRGSNGHLIYVDINTAPEWDDSTVRLIDLDLDVVAGPDLVPRVIDEDEFDEHRLRWEYPPAVVDRARTTAARVAAAIARPNEPFATEGFAWVARRLGWAHGRVVSGHGAASDMADDHVGSGTIAAQLPHFVAVGIPVEGFHPATIDVELPFPLAPDRPLATLTDVRWSEDSRAETFSFFDARLAVDGQVHRVIAYQSHSGAEPHRHEPANVIEVLAPPLERITPGAPVSLWIEPDQAHFDVTWAGSDPRRNE